MTVDENKIILKENLSISSLLQFNDVKKSQVSEGSKLRFSVNVNKDHFVWQKKRKNFILSLNRFVPSRFDESIPFWICHTMFLQCIIWLPDSRFPLHKSGLENTDM